MTARPQRARHVVQLALALAALALPRGVEAAEARAYDARPHDAPRDGSAFASTPPLPAEYLTYEDSGIRFAYQPSTRDRVRPLFESAGAIRAELVAQLGRDVLGSVEIRIAAVHDEMVRLAPNEKMPTFATTVAFSEAHLVVMSATSPVSFDRPNLEGSLRHALAHLALDEALGGKAVPRWFHEGYAVHVSGEDAALRTETLCRASLGNGILGLRELEGQLPADAQQSPVAYAEAADFARFLTDGTNRRHFAAMIAKVRDGEPFEGALAAAYGGADVGRVELSWRKEMTRRYSFLPVLAGAMVLCMMVAFAVLARRFRRRRALRAARGTGPRITRPSARARRPRADDEGLGGLRLPPPGVPKIEHDGRWHTLH